MAFLLRIAANDIMVCRTRNMNGAWTFTLYERNSAAAKAGSRPDMSSQPGLIDSIHYTDHNRFIRHETRTIMNRKQRYWNDQWIKRAEIQKHCSSFRKLVRLPYRFFCSIQHYSHFIVYARYCALSLTLTWRWQSLHCTELYCILCMCACMGSERCAAYAVHVWCDAVRYGD